MATCQHVQSKTLMKDDVLFEEQNVEGVFTLYKIIAVSSLQSQRCEHIQREHNVAAGVEREVEKDRFAHLNDSYCRCITVTVALGTSPFGQRSV